MSGTGPRHVRARLLFNGLGLGKLGYTLHACFDTAHLRVLRLIRALVRLTREDMAEIHANQLRQLRGYGSIFFDVEELSRAELMWDPRVAASSSSGFATDQANG